jgi:hypothetical protein
MPGGDYLVTELGVGRDTIKAALQQLEDEGILVGQGRRKRRRINLPSQLSKVRALRVRILLYENGSRARGTNIELLRNLQESGYVGNFAKKTLTDLGMNVEQVAKFVNQTPGDAWIVEAGSREVLEWFAAQSVPAFAMYGVKSGVSIAGSSPKLDPGIVVKRLVTLGHQRIVLLVRDDRLTPKPALFEQAYLDELESHGIISGPYNLPNWGNSREEFHRCLDSLFHLSHCRPGLSFAARAHRAS